MKRRNLYQYFGKPLFLMILFGGLFTVSVHAQEVVLRGIISGVQAGRPLDAANITLQKLSGKDGRGTISDENGLYQFSQVTPGDYVFMVRYVGYETYLDTLTISGNSPNVTKSVTLNPSNEEMEEVVVSYNQAMLGVGQTRIRPENLSRTPSPAGSSDLVGYLQTLPGVLATGDRGGQLFVRGGTPSENMALMDGMLIYQPFHIVGFFSVFPEDIISSADFYAGGFGAQYSGRTSSVMDIRLKNGDLYETNWSASISPFLGSALVETPLHKGTSSVMVLARGSLIEESSKLYLPEQQPLKFNSQLVKFYTNRQGKGLSCSATFLHSYDRGQLDFEEDEFFRWTNLVTSGRCAGVMQDAGISYTDINFGISYFNNEAGDGALLRTSSILRYEFDVNFTQHMGNWQLDFGAFSSYQPFQYQISERFTDLQEEENVVSLFGGFASVDIPFGDKFSMETGVALTSYPFQMKGTVEPRMQLTWKPRGRTDEEIHAAVGIYDQPIIGITDYRDAGTAFTAWMPAPNPDRIMSSKHALLGWRQLFGKRISFLLEGYYKLTDNIPVSTWSSVAQFSTSLAYADGTTKGVDIRLDYNARNIYFGVNYGYSFTEYETSQPHFERWFGVDSQTYHPPHDRRHQVNLHGGFEKGNFSLNLSWIYGSGFPFTRPLGFDSYFSFAENPPDVTTDYGTPRVLLDKLFNGKLPDFHRLDVSAEQAFKVSDNLNMKVQVGAINAYDWKNLFYYDVYYQKEIDQLSILPYVSLKVES